MTNQGYPYLIRSWQTFYEARHSVDLGNEDLFPSDGKLTYPVHPFDPDLCDSIARFRPGLTDMALSGALSHQSIVLIAQINNWDRDMYNSLKDHDVYSLHELSTNS